MASAERQLERFSIISGGGNGLQMVIDTWEGNNCIGAILWDCLLWHG